MPVANVAALFHSGHSGHSGVMSEGAPASKASGMARRPCLLLMLVCALSPLPAMADADTLPANIARVASALGVAPADFSIAVHEIGQPQALLRHNAAVMRTPASTMKLVTTFAALQGLTPAYRWKTEAYAQGPIRDGVLEGDLILRGSGDPYLVQEEFWKLTNGINAAGVRRIEGDLVFDNSHFRLPPESAGAFDGEPDRVYNLVPHPLLVNFNAMRFEFEPAGSDVRVTTAPALRNVEVRNRLRIQPGACGGFQRGIALHVLEPPQRNQVSLEGAFPATCQRYAMTRSVLEPETYAFGLFDKYWSQLGGELTGQWRNGDFAAGVHPVPAQLLANASSSEPPAVLEPFHVHYSRSLGEIVRLVNKYSNNVMTRHLQLTLGAERFEPPATPEKGEQATLDVLATFGIDTTGMVIDNPSGLSRTALLSADQLASLLTAAWDAPYMPEFISSLAISGLDGTLTHRFRSMPEAGRMHLKTGTIDNVSAIAGYVHTLDNRRLVVVVMVNAPLAHRGPGEEIQDAVLRWAFHSS